MKIRYSWSVVLASVLAASACSAGGPVTAPTTPPRIDSTKPPGIVGTLNLDVQQNTIYQTICLAGWTATIRPSSDYTNRLKRQQLPKGARLSDYEEDHIISLSVGGAPSDPHNLLPVALERARADDVLERELNHEICSGQLTLAQAQLKESELKRDLPGLTVGHL